MVRHSIIGEFLHIAKLGFIRRKWHKLHPDSDTLPMNSFNFDHVSIGKGSYGELNVVDFGGKERVIIKDYVSIAQKVSFIINAEHYVDHLSTYPFRVKTLHMSETESFGKGDIIVDDDVWIGYGATILSGVHIGQGAVIAAGAVVSKDVPPYAIVGGVPAKVIRYRFCPEVIEFLLTLDFGALDEQMIREHVDDLYETIDGKNLEVHRVLFAWFPKKDKAV